MADAQINAPGSNMPGNLFNQTDSSGVDSMRADWVDEQAKIHYTTLQSEMVRYPDSTIDKVHHFQATQPWWGNDLGNYGTAARNLFFTPDMRPGMQLGYNIYDLYRLQLDSLGFYNTTRPYSAFAFMLGSKNQQNVDILHTQNITPLWNFAARLRYLSSEGFFAQQKANSISGSFNTDYAGKSQRYRMKAAFLYNRFRQDENGGILSDSFLTLGAYTDRRRIPVNFPALVQNGDKSAVSNMLRNWDLYVQNSYSWGKADTVYNEDSTKATYRFTPRFRLEHALQLHSEKHTFEDVYPDSLRYAIFGPIHFNPRDSVFGSQDWFYVDNKFSLNGFLGRNEHLARIKAGIGNRVDQFQSEAVNHRSKETSVGNYIFGELRKEALEAGQWAYYADAQLYFTGAARGDFSVSASAGKNLGNWAQFSAGLQQSLSSPPYAWEHLATNFYKQDFDLHKISATRLWGKISFDHIKLEIGVNNYLMAHYLYINDSLRPVQDETPFSLLQVYGRKKFTHRIFSWDNELVWQQATSGAPVHLPAFMIRTQLGVEAPLFGQALRVASGLEVMYTTNYYCDGYTPYLNQFYYQTAFKTGNVPEVSAYFNFKVRNFRAYVIGGQLQELITKNNLRAPGYPAPNALFRFGFIWVLIN